MSDDLFRPSEQDDAIISPDANRPVRIPPNQVRTRKFPVLHVGEVPPFDPNTWDLTIFPRPLVKEPKRFTYSEFMSLPRVRVYGDMHCVTRWSQLDNLWEGVATRELLRHVELDERAKFVMLHCDGGFTTNLPVEDFFDEDCLFAFRRNGEDLCPDHGWPLRLVVPKLYAWKSPKWVRGVEFMEENQPGYWEEFTHGGYHMRGDPWEEQRHRPDSERYRDPGGNL